MTTIKPQNITPDISFTWHDRAKCYMVKGLNPAGMALQNRLTPGIKMLDGKLVPASLVESWYELALNLGLTCERIDPE